MEAIIMAGGKGTRLKPLTDNMPKPMARLCGKPILEYTLALLEQNGFQKATLTTGYLQKNIEEYFGNKSYGIPLKYHIEKEPLGTAGSVKASALHCKDSFLVISGDGICDFNLKELAEFHIEKNSLLTVGTVQVDDPREYGIVLSEDDGKIRGFAEKPSWPQAVSGLVNTGIYVIHPKILSLIPPNKPFDFAKDLFPLLLEKNIPVYAKELKGYWCDIGTAEAYRKCQYDFLDGKIKLQSVLPKQAERAHCGYQLIEPCFISPTARIGEKTVIGPYTVIDNNAVIGENCRIDRSVILQNCVIDNNTNVSSSVIAKDCTINSGVLIASDCCIGEKTAIEKNVYVPGNTQISSQSIISYPFYCTSQKSDKGLSDIFDEKLVTTTSQNTVDYYSNYVLGFDTFSLEGCLKLGYAIGSNRRGKRTLLGYSSDKLSVPKFFAVQAGLYAAGADIFVAENCFAAQINFISLQYGTGTCIFIDNGNIFVSSQGGLPFEREFERTIEKNKFTFVRDYSVPNRPPFHIRDFQQTYMRFLLLQANGSLQNCNVWVKSTNRVIERTMQNILQALGSKQNGLEFQISHGGESVTAVSNGKEFTHEILAAICCRQEIENGNDVAVPYNYPLFFDEIAKQSGCNIRRYLSSSYDCSDEPARRLANKQIYLRDGLMLTLRVLGIMRDRKMTLNELADELPITQRKAKCVPVSFPPNKLEKALGGEPCVTGNGEGIRIKKSKGHILVIPTIDGGAANIFSDCRTAEAAEELCISIENLLKSFAEKNDNIK